LPQRRQTFPPSGQGLTKGPLARRLEAQILIFYEGQYLSH
jgi:hypothetical protein